uniref:Putative secreted protein n=1 Tax=Ixodes ricinus TaxID=34613 RepID=A0A6B0UN74_IXORI
MEGTLVELRKNWFCLLLFVVAVNTHFFRVATFSCDSFAPRCVMRRRFANTKMDIEYFSIVILHSLAAFNLLTPPAPARRSVGRSTSGMCIQIRPEGHRPILFCAGAGGVGKSNAAIVYI